MRPDTMDVSFLVWLFGGDTCLMLPTTLFASPLSATVDRNVQVLKVERVLLQPG